MYVDICKYKRGQKTYRRILLRESFRENGKVKQRTIANISHLTDEQILVMKAALNNQAVPIEDVPDIRSRPGSRSRLRGARLSFPGMRMNLKLFRGWMVVTFSRPTWPRNNVIHGRFMIDTKIYPRSSWLFGQWKQGFWKSVWFLSAKKNGQVVMSSSPC